MSPVLSERVHSCSLDPHCCLEVNNLVAELATGARKTLKISHNAVGVSRRCDVCNVGLVPELIARRPLVCVGDD